MKKRRDVVCKLECGLCGFFLGIVTSDGQGPLLDDCPSSHPGLRAECLMVEKLAKYQPLSVRRHVRGETDHQETKATKTPEGEL